MSVHKDCGENIHWFEREEGSGRFHPPMEYAGTVMVNIDGKMIETTGYRPHRCDVDKVIAWQEYVEKMAEVKGPDSFEAGLNLYAIARERDREERWAQALTIDCSVCDAEAGVKCMNLTIAKRTGDVVEVLNPHPARLEAAFRRTTHDPDGGLNDE